MTDRLQLAVPSKGRIMEDTLAAFAAVGLTIRKVGHERGYRGEVAGVPGIDVAFMSASEIAEQIKSGRAHMGVTGEDLLVEIMADARTQADFVKALGFGHADVVVAVPEAWIDVTRMADLERMAPVFRREHGRAMRVATKYKNTTRRFFASKGVSSYRIVESLGATERAPAAATAELIVDITSTGETLKANGLKRLGDGTILRSEANLVAARPRAPWPATVSEMAALVRGRFRTGA